MEMDWTQADLAARLGASRVAVSHFEVGLALPSERTVVLLAGLFKVEPHELVAGTNYPNAKQERLPATVCRYTELELQLALLRRDLTWLERLRTDPTSAVSQADILGMWRVRLDGWRAMSLEQSERSLIDEGWVLLRAVDQRGGVGRARQSAAST